AHVLHQAAPQPLVPPDPIDVDRVGLRGVRAHMEGDAPALVDAGRGRIALDLAHRVRPPATEPPLARPRLLALDLDRTAPGRHRRWRQPNADGRSQAEP